MAEGCNVLLNLVCLCDCSQRQMSAAKRKDDQKVKDQGKKEDHKTKKARVDAKKDTVRLSTFVLSESYPSCCYCPLLIMFPQGRINCEGLGFPHLGIRLLSKSCVFSCHDGIGR